MNNSMHLNDFDLLGPYNNYCTLNLTDFPCSKSTENAQRYCFYAAIGY